MKQRVDSSGADRAGGKHRLTSYQLLQGDKNEKLKPSLTRIPMQHIQIQRQRQIQIHIQIQMNMRIREIKTLPHPNSQAAIVAGH